MRMWLSAAVLLLGTTPAFAGPTLSWDTVTTDINGAPLPAGQEVKSYTVYRCATNVNPCVKASGVVVGSVPATAPVVPRQGLDLVGQPFPGNFMVTATNIVAESLESLSFKITPASTPKNLQLN